MATMGICGGCFWDRRRGCINPGGAVVVPGSGCANYYNLVQIANVVRIQAQLRSPRLPERGPDRPMAAA